MLPSNNVDARHSMRDCLIMSGRRWLHLCALLFFTAAALTTAAESPFSLASTPGQLPKSIVPRHYSIHLQPDLEKLTTHGSVVIEIEALKPVKQVVLNALELDITKATLIAHGNIE